MDPIKRTVLVAMPRFDENGCINAIDWEESSRDDWYPSMADVLCPQHVELDLRHIKAFAPALAPKVKNFLRVLRSGFTFGNKTWYVSGTTQATKSGKLIAYEISDFWPQNGAGKRKDMVRGGAVHAPCRGPIFSASVQLRFDKASLHTADGQIAVGWQLYGVMTNLNKLDIACGSRRNPQIRAVSNSGTEMREGQST
jgi:hypothetical protein